MSLALETAHGDTTASISEVGAALGKNKASHISVAHNELIKKGLVYFPDRGLLAFTVPGMHDFIACCWRPPPGATN